MKEPTNNLDEIVPGRLTSAELRAMALRQQQQIDSQHQLLATKEQRLRFLKTQEVRNAVANAEGERLRRLRERVEAQESKLRRLRALRGQVDLQKTYNVTLSNDLDSIRALFSEKEKELSLAVAKVEALTRQLEDLRRDRRCPINLIAGGNGTAQPLPPQASRELEKLRRELMYRNQLSLQQDARLHLQREALQQRQAELRSVDQRIYELQTRLQRKKAANIQIVAQNQNHHQLHVQATTTTQHQQQQQHLLQQQQQQQQTYNTDASAAAAFQTNLAKQGVAALKQQLLQKQAAAAAAANQNAQHNAVAAKFSSIINRGEPNRNIARGNVAAVEPYIHTPQKSTITPTASYLGAGNILKHAAATANTNQQNQLIQDLTHVKLNLSGNAHTTNNASNANSNSSTAAATAAANSHLNNAPSAGFFSGESDETKLAKKMLTASIAAKSNEAATQKQVEIDNTHIYAEVGPKKRDLVKEVAANLEAQTNAASNQQLQQQQQPGSKIPKSIVAATSASALINKLNSAATHQLPATAKDAKSEHDKKSDMAVVSSETLSEKNQTPQLTVHSMPLGTANKSVATAVSNLTTDGASLMPKPKPLQHLVAGSLAVPPRKPISSVAPTSVSSAIPKMITYSPKVNRVAPNVVASATAAAGAAANNAERPALPPKPSKMSPTEAERTDTGATSATAAKKSTLASAAEIPPPQSTTTMTAAATLGLQTLNINDNLPIKAKPLTIRKQPMSEQPRLKSVTTVPKPATQTARKMDSMPNAANYQLTEGCSNNNNNNKTKELHEQARASPEAAASMQQQQQSSPPQQQQHSPPNRNSSPPQSGCSADEPDRLDNGNAEKSSPDSLKRRVRANSTPGAGGGGGGGGKPKLTRRVSFDPLALLLDASLEGELELVKKTAQQVANPSAANDEGITALHNAICAGHFDIVKFLVEFGCDVNAQDSDGWTPLHCAASCNNLSMVKFLVESGACLFASTLSDHETPAEKCEEDEEGFDGCSEYLYSIQEKLGILHSGEVYAVFSYEAQNSDELTFNVNDRLVILRKSDDAESEWWWAKDANDEEGYVPRNLLGLYPRVPPQSSNFND